jgi:dethiobiotin synthetase
VRGLFVTGTGTGVGKTIVSAALLAAMRAAGEPVRAHKPVVTGLEEPLGLWPPDHELLAAAAGMSPEDVAPLRYGPAVSPHLAATLAGEPVDPHKLVERARASWELTDSFENAGSSTEPSPTLVIEGVGGLLVPLADDFTVRDLAVELGLPLVVAAKPGLGTINHTLLTLEAARGVGLTVCAVVLTPWPARPSAVEHSNRETIGRLGAIEVWGLPYLSSPEPVALGRAGASLPLKRWLSRQSNSAKPSAGDTSDSVGRARDA